MKIIIIHEEKETKSKRVQLLMQPSLHREIEKAAKKAGTSFNNYVHKALEEKVF